MSETPPEPAPLLTVDCWLIDVRGLSSEQLDAWNGAEAEQRERAARMASYALRGLTGGAVEPCMYAGRPCSAPCTPPTYMVYPVDGSHGTTFSPRLDSGTWINVPCCGVAGCGHKLSSIRIPGATEVVSVWVDGVELPQDAYALRGDRLVRSDGSAWPQCQNMDADRSEVNTFEVDYYRRRPGAAGEQAAGRLAIEYLAAILDDGECALPSSVVTAVTRAGVSITRAVGAFPGGMTGVRDVDAWVALINPNRLSSPNEVLSPDMMR